MKIYTKTGDKGTTSLVGGTRVVKNDIRLDAYGTVDELNSWIGFIISCLNRNNERVEKVTSFLIKTQNNLFNLGCVLATEADSKWQPIVMTAEDVCEIEKELDLMQEILPTHDKFILPGGTMAASSAQIARTVCRRAERIIVSLAENTCPGQTQALIYVNRLSDYLFVLSRFLNHIEGVPETFWEAPSH